MNEQPICGAVAQFAVCDREPDHGELHHAISDEPGPPRHVWWIELAGQAVIVSDCALPYSQPPDRRTVDVRIIELQVELIHESGVPRE